MTDDQLLVWADTLASLDFEPARAALRKLRAEVDFLPSHRQVIEATKHESRMARLELAAPRGQPGTFKCPCGEGQGWVTLGDVVRPCQICRPVLYEQWMAGHYDPKHDRAGCAECQRRGAA